MLLVGVTIITVYQHRLAWTHENKAHFVDLELFRNLNICAVKNSASPKS